MLRKLITDCHGAWYFDKAYLFIYFLKSCSVFDPSGPLYFWDFKGCFIHVHSLVVS